MLTCSSKRKPFVRMPHLSIINKSCTKHAPRVPSKRRVPWPPFPLLRLPAELRNRIYELVLEDLGDEQDHRQFPSVFHILRRYDIPMHPTQDYRGLTQVCCQLRSEFRPLYMDVKTVYVGVAQAHDYLQAYYPELGPEATTPITHEDVLVIVLEQEAMLTVGSRALSNILMPEPIYNLQPILECVYEKQIAFSFAANTVSNSQIGMIACDLNAWILDHEDAWRVTIKRDLRRVILECNDRGSPCLHFVFKPGHWQSWIPEAANVRHSQGGKAYYSSLGLGSRFNHPSIEVE
ncbi:hypothetical protein EJ02DRAFT_378609 [Clathrospora elynae]|uniref:F-box domain-containing protein n=1 Tax=Clathrospora elynae TaxID=706981 RepID=A0A6A5SMW9_9PLEO|nr:hypothetical protein EJ02DRAFT_378609 [Clathrospora elynae]